MVEDSESWSDRLWQAFSSMKMGLALLGIIALIAGIGTLIPQTEQDPQKAHTVGQLWQSLGFTHLYRIPIQGIQLSKGTISETFSVRINSAEVVFCPMVSGIIGILI